MSTRHADIMGDCGRLFFLPHADSESNKGKRERIAEFLFNSAHRMDTLSQSELFSLHMSFNPLTVAVIVFPWKKKRTVASRHIPVPFQ